MRKQLNSAFVFTSWIGQSLYFINLKFQASSLLIWLYILVLICVRHGNPKICFLTSKVICYMNGYVLHVWICFTCMDMFYMYGYVLQILSEMWLNQNSLEGDRPLSNQSLVSGLSKLFTRKKYFYCRNKVKLVQFNLIISGLTKVQFST